MRLRKMDKDRTYGAGNHFHFISINRARLRRWAGDFAGRYLEEFLGLI
jgi:hypothetical protein